MAGQTVEKDLVFFVNGRKVVETEPDPEMSLLIYLRRKLRLTGSKLGCGEGGCGACTVMVSKYTPETDYVDHISVNACLAPVCSMHGLAVTTVEGIGNLNNIHPVQERIARFHGSQCGFCTPGIVMSMYTLLRTNPEPSGKEMEEYFDGNLCRCTGYRPILDGFRTFTKEYQCPMGESCCRNRTESTNNSDHGLVPVVTDLKPYSPDQEAIFPPELKVNHDLYRRKTMRFAGHKCQWIQPAALQELINLKADHPEAKLVIGNTEVGIEMKLKSMKYKVLICPNNIPELSSVSVGRDGITLGGTVTLTRLNTELQRLVNTQPEHKTRSFSAIIEMLKWFASHQIRNVASVCGNIMTASPISDLNPLFMAAGVTLYVTSRDRGSRTVTMDKHFFTGYRKTAIAGDEVLVSLTIPFTEEGEYFAGFKQANRKEDDISLVTAGMRVKLSADHVITDCSLSFGGMAAMTSMADTTNTGLIGAKWNDDLVSIANETLASDLPLAPGSPGGVAEYRRSLALSFFFKFYLSVRQQIGHTLVPTDVSAVQELDQPEGQSMQVYGARDNRDSEHGSLGHPLHHRSALQQSTGQALFVDDMPPTADELYMVLVTSTKAHAKIIGVDTSVALRCPGVVDYICASDVPGQNSLGTIMDHVFAEDEVTSFGQIIGGIVADTHDHARVAARLVKVQYEELDAIITIKEAISKGSFHQKPLVMKSGDVEATLGGSAHRLEGEAHMNGQYHFYMETCACRSIPIENGEMEIFSSTQNLSDEQKFVATVLGVPASKIHVRTKRLGGGFGGKEEQSMFVTVPSAVAAVKHNRAVRCVLDRDDDMVVTGNRHPFLGKYKVGFTPEGVITALDLDLYCNAGNTLDLTRPALERAMMGVNMSYGIRNFKVTGYMCRTNITSNTAFRGFGAPQGAYVLETIIDEIAAYLNLEPRKVQERNFFKPGEQTFYKTDAGGDIMKRCWDMCVEKSQYVHRRKEIEDYNRVNQWKKKGIALFPLCFGISFMQKCMNQAGALVHVYRDGSVFVSHGGVEMGQGLHTKMIQVASEILNLPQSKIHISETSTATVPNTSPTAASVSTDLNGMAVKDACEKLRTRLVPYVKKRPNGTWEEWIIDAYSDCTSLSSTGFYYTPHIGFNMETNEGRPFNYFTYGAACSEVHIDCLTGDHKVLRTDIVMDIGQSINPAIDVGQIEGAFVQGLGLFLLEEIKVTPGGIHLTRGPGNYKIPAFGDIPNQFNVYIVPDSKNPNAVFASRGLNEPPLLLALSAFLAVKDAIRAARKDNSAEMKFELLSPAVPNRIRMACKDAISSKFPEAEPGSYKPWFVDL